MDPLCAILEPINGCASPPCGCVEKVKQSVFAAASDDNEKCLISDELKKVVLVLVA
jgi:hypothetical protein